MLDLMQRDEVSLQDIQKQITQLPLPQKIRTLAIYNRYKKIREIKQELQKQIKILDKKNIQLTNPIIQNINKIVLGKQKINQDDLKDASKYLNGQQIQKIKQHLQGRKIQSYWYKVLTNSSFLQKFLGSDDQCLLKSINNIYSINQDDSDNFTIVVQFAQNNIISNKQLRKKLYLKDFHPIKTQSTVIEWKGRNLTRKQVKKKQKNKKTGQQRIITKQVETKSFFNFFKNIQINTNLKQQQLTKQQIIERDHLDMDYQIAGVLVDDIIPFSFQYYLGIQHQGSIDLSQNEESQNSEDEEDDKKKKDVKKKNKSKSKSKSKQKTSTQNKNQKNNTNIQKPQCKQQ